MDWTKSKELEDVYEAVKHFDIEKIFDDAEIDDDRCDIIIERFKKLSDKSKTIILFKMGYDDKQRSNEEIAKILDTTPMRVIYVYRNFTRLPVRRTNNLLLYLDSNK